MAFQFTKMHGTGNDYVFVDAIRQPEIAQRADLPELARRISHRNTGVGGDGLILLCPVPEDVAEQCNTTEGDNTPPLAFHMRIFNADGSEAETCGNGLRCAVKLAVETGLVEPAGAPIRVHTNGGDVEAHCELTDEGQVAAVTVDMGEPVLDPECIPVNLEVLGTPPANCTPHPDGRIIHTLVLNTPGRRRSDPPRVLDAVFVNMGNPHAVFLHSNVAGLDLNHIGPMIENHPAFPERINAHFVQPVSPDEVIMRTWERGSGITQACGSGAAAVCVAGVLREKMNRRVLIHAPGGDLRLFWSPENHRVHLTGPAEAVFTGEWCENAPSATTAAKAAWSPGEALLA